MSTIKFADLFRAIAFFENVIYANEESFCETFCKFGDEVYELASISFSTNYIFVRMLGLDGVHILNQISWKQALPWFESLTEGS